MNLYCSAVNEFWNKNQEIIFKKFGYTELWFYVLYCCTALYLEDFGEEALKISSFWICIFKISRLQLLPPKVILISLRCKWDQLWRHVQIIVSCWNIIYGISSGLLNESWFCLILVCWDAFSCKVLRDFV